MSLKVNIRFVFVSFSTDAIDHCFYGFFFLFFPLRFTRGLISPSQCMCGGLCVVKMLSAKIKSQLTIPQRDTPIAILSGFVEICYREVWDCDVFSRSLFLNPWEQNSISVRKLWFFKRRQTLYLLRKKWTSSIFDVNVGLHILKFIFYSEYCWRNANSRTMNRFVEMWGIFFRKFKTVWYIRWIL